MNDHLCGFADAMGSVLGISEACPNCGGEIGQDASGSYCKTCDWRTKRGATNSKEVEGHEDIAVKLQ